MAVGAAWRPPSFPARPGSCGTGCQLANLWCRDRRRTLIELILPRNEPLRHVKAKSVHDRADEQESVEIPYIAGRDSESARDNVSLGRFLLPPGYPESTQGRTQGASSSFPSTKANSLRVRAVDLTPLRSSRCRDGFRRGLRDAEKLARIGRPGSRSRIPEDLDIFVSDRRSKSFSSRASAPWNPCSDEERRIAGVPWKPWAGEFDGPQGRGLDMRSERGAVGPNSGCRRPSGLAGSEAGVPASDTKRYNPDSSKDPENGRRFSRMVRAYKMLSLKAPSP